MGAISLTDDKIEGFVKDGFVKIAGAFSTETADACRERLWREISCASVKPSHRAGEGVPRLVDRVGAGSRS